MNWHKTKKRLPTRSRFFMQNTEGVHRPPLSQKAPAPIAYHVFFGQKPALYSQKTPVFYPNTEGVIKKQTLDYRFDNQAFVC
jgi:hypothetical protein